LLHLKKGNLPLKNTVPLMFHTLKSRNHQLITNKFFLRIVSKSASTNKQCGNAADTIISSALLPKWRWISNQFSWKRLKIPIITLKLRIFFNVLSPKLYILENPSLIININPPNRFIKTQPKILLIPSL
jgi:hypothetical protein